MPHSCPPVPLEAAKRSGHLPRARHRKILLRGPLHAVTDACGRPVVVPSGSFQPSLFSVSHHSSDAWVREGARSTAPRGTVRLEAGFRPNRSATRKSVSRPSRRTAWLYQHEASLRKTALGHPDALSHIAPKPVLHSPLSLKAAEQKGVPTSKNDAPKSTQRAQHRSDEQHWPRSR